MRLDVMQRQQELELLEDIHTRLLVEIERLECKSKDGQERTPHGKGVLCGRLKQCRTVASFIYRRIDGRRRSLRKALELCK